MREVRKPVPTWFTRFLDLVKEDRELPNDSALARLLNVDQSMISHWRRGRRPSVALLWEISRALDVPIAALLELAGYVEQAEKMKE